MTDRELLDLAAKAAGVVLEDEHYWRDGFWTRWNPLKDDGDALRLAVKLAIAPIQDKPASVCAAYWTDVHCCHATYDDDPYAATRRAIVRAAAEIGKSM